jgi:hypothetical protein
MFTLTALFVMMLAVSVIALVPTGLVMLGLVVLGVVGAMRCCQRLMLAN